MSCEGLEQVTSEAYCYTVSEERCENRARRVPCLTTGFASIQLSGQIAILYSFKNSIYFHALEYRSKCQI